MHARPACAAGMVYVALTCHKAPWDIVRAFIVSAGTLVATRGSHPSWPCEPQSPKTARTSQYGRRWRSCRVAPSRPRSRRLLKRCRSWRGLGSWRHGAKHKATAAICPCAPHRQHDAGVIARATACSWIRSEMHGMRSGFVGGNRAHRRGALVPRSGRALCITRVRRAARGVAPLVNRRSRRG